MIFVTDKGRLCNNIIQYGHLYAWGREHGRQTMSMRFAYKYKDFHISHIRYHIFLVYVLAMGWCVRFYDLFVKYKGEIQKLFAFSDKIEEKVRETLSAHNDNRLRLGVHIRRGDYGT